MRCYPAIRPDLSYDDGLLSLFDESDTDDETSLAMPAEEVPRRRLREKQPPPARPADRPPPPNGPDRAHQELEAIGTDRTHRDGHKFGPKPDNITQAQ